MQDTSLPMLTSDLYPSHRPGAGSSSGKLCASEQGPDKLPRTDATLTEGTVMTGGGGEGAEGVAAAGVAAEGVAAGAGTVWL